MANTIGRAVIFNDVTIAPDGPPSVEVITTAKRDLKKGRLIDSIGGYDAYGLCENTITLRNEKILPLGLSEGCILKEDIKKDSVILMDDVILPKDRLIDRLYHEQCSME